VGLLTSAILFGFVVSATKRLRKNNKNKAVSSVAGDKKQKGTYFLTDK
jgi:hypothetical protein